MNLRNFNRGSGDHGRSKVYLGYHADFGIVVAKVMRIERFDSNEFFKIGALNKPEFASPFIMKCFKAKQFLTNIVILMEYANAKSLELIFKDNKKKLSIGTLRALAQQIWMFICKISRGQDPSKDNYEKNTEFIGILPNGPKI
ncbi:MAG: hypothetical protein EZS28_024627 [Streblomastix strix]|uniref:Protein kinase domain-containing protein n=1 Tax=Streblomastix strix TaxID=222440 RepID=A0A5J4VBM3_9EUKA|nr:MAG: hypothetical protein EZS28_024627 [Streblomastix strix]